jgi:hypothetical protein
MESLPHMETLLLPIKYPCKTRKFSKPAAMFLKEKNHIQIGSPYDANLVITWSHNP